MQKKKKIFISLAIFPQLHLLLSQNWTGKFSLILKDSCDQIWLIQIIQDYLPILKFFI